MKKNIKTVLNTRAVISILCITTLFTFAGCFDEVKAPNAPTAYVALFHGSPNGPALDIKVDNGLTNDKPFEYGDYTGYVRYYPRERNFKIGPHSTNETDIEENFTFEKDKFYSLFIAGEYQDAEIILLEDNSAVPPSNKSKVRIINLSPDAGNIDLKVSGNIDNWINDLAFKDATEFMEVGASDYNFEIRASETNAVLLSLPNTLLEGGQLFTIILRGYKNVPEGSQNVLGAQIERN